MSIELQQCLGYSAAEVYGHSISILEETTSLEGTIRQYISEGFFSDLEVDLHKKSGELVRYSISGFYLGLISDMSGIIVLKFSNQQEISTLDQQLQLTKAQLDNFIYRAAHDIRGPLATIQGLTNLIKMRKDDSEVDRFVNMIDAHSKVLDDRLSKLLFLAHVDEEESEPNYEVDVYDLETHLRKVIEHNAFIDFLELNFTIHSCTIKGVNEVLLQKILTNLVLFVLTLPKCSDKNLILISCEQESSLLVIHIRTVGFLADQPVYNGINERDASTYTDLLKYSKLTHIFAAQKIASKLKASIQIEAPTMSELNLTIMIPQRMSSFK